MMDPKQAARRVTDWIADYMDSRKGFVPEGKRSVSFWHPDDTAALAILSVTPNPPGDYAGASFVCASCLDPAGPLVTGWIEECLAEATRALPAELSLLREIRPICTREDGPGLEPT